ADLELRPLADTDVSLAQADAVRFGREQQAGGAAVEHVDDFVAGAALCQHGRVRGLDLHALEIAARDGELDRAVPGAEARDRQLDVRRPAQTLHAEVAQDVPRSVIFAGPDGATAEEPGETDRDEHGGRHPNHARQRPGTL